MGRVAVVTVVVLCASARAGAQPAAPTTPPVSCPAPAQPVFVFTENLSPPLDLCAAFHRASANVSLAAIPAGQVSLRIRLDPIMNRETSVWCNVRIDAHAQTGRLVSLQGSASVAFQPAPSPRASTAQLHATRDCVDALVEDVLRRVERSTVASLPKALPPPLRTTPPPPPLSTTPPPVGAAVAAAPSIEKACSSRAPLVHTVNRSTAHGDLCAAYHRAARGISFAASRPLAFRVYLDEVVASSTSVACKLHVSVRSTPALPASFAGAATVPIGSGSAQAATRGCLDDTLYDVLRRIEKALTSGP